MPAPNTPPGDPRGPGPEETQGRGEDEASPGGCSFQLPGADSDPVPSLSGFDAEVVVRGSFTKDRIARVELLTDCLRDTRGLQPAISLPLQEQPTSCEQGCLATNRFEKPLRPGRGQLVARATGHDGTVLCEASLPIEVNSPPSVSNLRTIPEVPLLHQDVSFAVDVTDPDGDQVHSAARWTPPEGNSITDPILGHSVSSAGQAWVLSVTPTDGLDTGPTIEIEVLFPVPEGMTDGPCPPGAVHRGQAPPRGTKTECQRPDGRGGWIEHGRTVTWWDSGKGIKRTETYWLDGKREGRSTAWHENAIKASEYPWKAGVLHGAASAWHSDGSLQANYVFVDGEKHGKETNWFSNDTKQYEMDSFHHGKRHGIETSWFPGGGKATRCEWTDGRLHGICQRWEPMGGLVEEIRYDEGQRHGSWARWFDNGTKAEEGRYEKGRPVGAWTRWRENGELLEQQQL